MSQSFRDWLMQECPRSGGTQSHALQAYEWGESPVAHSPTRGQSSQLCSSGEPLAQLTHDLLEIQVETQSLPCYPDTIMNLRIAAVGTVSSDAEFPLEEPYRTSRLWLGVSLFGTGDFKTHQREEIEPL